MGLLPEHIYVTNKQEITDRLNTSVYKAAKLFKKILHYFKTPIYKIEIEIKIFIKNLILNNLKSIPINNNKFSKIIYVNLLIIWI